MCPKRKHPPLADQIVISEPPLVAGGLSIDQSAQYLDIGRSSVYRLINEGEIRIIRLGRRTIVPRSELDRLIERRLAESVPTHS